MSQQVTIPGIDYKVDKIKLIIIIAIVILIVIFISNPSGVISSLLKGIFNTASNAAGGAIEGAAQAVGISGNSSNSDKTAATQYINNYYAQYYQNPNGYWTADLYNANQGASNLSYDDLLQSAETIYNDALGSSIFGYQVGKGSAANLAQPNTPGLAMCQSKVDVSNLCVVYRQQYGKDLLYDIVKGPDNVFNDAPGDINGASNMVILANIFKQLEKLPTK